MKEKKKVCGCLILGKSSNLLPFGGEGHREDLKIKLFLMFTDFCSFPANPNEPKSSPPLCKMGIFSFSCCSKREMILGRWHCSMEIWTSLTCSLPGYQNIPRYGIEGENLGKLWLFPLMPQALWKVWLCKSSPKSVPAHGEVLECSTSLDPDRVAQGKNIFWNIMEKYP